MLTYLKPLLLISLLVLITPVAIAQKIAVVDINKAATDSDYAQSEINKLLESEDYKKSVERYKNLRAEVESLQKEGKANELTWSEQQKQDQLNKIRGRIKELKVLGGEIDNAKLAVNRRYMQELAPQMKQIIKEMVTEKKLDLLLSAEAAYYKAPASDITQELTERLNKSNATE